MAMTMKKINATTIDEYIRNFPPSVRKIMKEVRSIIRDTAPGAEETISYGIPTFKLNGSYVIYFGGFSSHLSVFPAPRQNEKFVKALASYKGGKGTVQFPYDEPLPAALIRRIVKFRLAENKRRAALKKATKKKS